MMNKYEDMASYKGTIKKKENGIISVVKENYPLIYDEDIDRFLSYFSKDNDMKKFTSLGATIAIAMDIDRLSEEEIKELEKTVYEESLPYGTDMDGYYVDEDSIVMESPSIKKGRR